MKKILLASMLASAPLLAQAADTAVEAIGYDVASSAIVIHGRNFVGPSQRAPEVRIGPVAARVTYYVDESIVVEAPAGLPAGSHAVVVTPAGASQSAQMRFALAVPVPYVIERSVVFARR